MRLRGSLLFILGSEIEVHVPIVYLVVISVMQARMVARGGEGSVLHVRRILVDNAGKGRVERVARVIGCFAFLDLGLQLPRLHVDSVRLEVEVVVLLRDEHLILLGFFGILFLDGIL